MNATEQQRLIIDYDGSAVVIAAPGSGKTFVLSEKIKKNLKVLKEHEGIIAISYTNKASLELKNRSLSKGENPKASFFGTIDKFNLSEIIIPFGKHLFGIPSSEIRIIKTSSLPVEESENFHGFRTKSNGAILKDDIKLLHTYFLRGIIFIETIGFFANYIFTNSSACQNYIKARYKYFYIDEFQDSGFEQNQLFLKIKLLGIKAIAVGDLNQSIYAFSGKDAKYLNDLTANEDFKYFKLDKNHRSDPSIINYSNYLLNAKTQLIPTENNFIFFKRVEGSEKEVANWLDEVFVNVLDEFKITKRKEIAVLTRTTRTSEMLNNDLQGPHKYFTTNELDTSLNIWSAVFSNLLHFCFNKNFKFIDVVELFTSFDKLNRNEVKALNELKNNIEIAIQLPKLDFEKLIDEFIKVASVIAPKSKNNESIELLRNVLFDPVQTQSYQAANEDEINILTLHKSKGLEYDFIFHLDLHEWVFPTKQPGPNNDFNNPKYLDLTQDINLHYVGITRARKGCCLVSSTKRTNSNGVIKNGRDSEFIWMNHIDTLRFKNGAKNS